MSNTDTSKYKSEIRAWSKKQVSGMKRNIHILTNKQKHLLIKTIKVKGVRKGKSSKLRSKHLADSLSYKVRNRFGTPERIIFPFEKHGFFIAVGASRGHSYKTNPRKKIEWYDSVFEKGVEELADIVVKHQADSAVKAAEF